MTSAVLDDSPALRLVPSTPPETGARSLRDAIEAVHEHCRQTEMRRMVRARDMAIERSKQSVTVSRSTFDSMQQRLREAVAVRRLTERGPIWMVAFDSLAPFALREVPAALSRSVGTATEAGDRTLPQLFVSGDAARLQRALFDREADVALTLQLRRADGHGPRCTVHLLAPDANEPDLRWACLVRLPQDDDAVVERAMRRPLSKPTQRPHADAWPLQSR